MNVGTVSQIKRFAVKSMLGESPDRVSIGESGITGDRTHALVDVESGKVASAKDPRKWAGLLGFRSWYDGEPTAANLVVTLPDGAQVRPDTAGFDAAVSAAVGRSVRLSAEPADGNYDYVWEVDGIAPDEVISRSQTDTTDEGKAVSTMPLAFMAPGTFQDVAPITIITTGALRWMSTLHPEGDWSPDRFRMNLLVETGDDVEPDWAGRRLTVGDVVLEVTSPAPRCVMTTLAQSELPRDRGVLQTLARHNMLEFAGLGKWACLGAYARVLTPGDISIGDTVTLTG